MTEESRVVVVQDEAADLAPSFVMSVDEARSKLIQLQDFVRSVMKKGEDYGQIPGVEKPTLLKPGAEKLCEIYGYAPEVDITNRVEDWDKPFFHYEVRVSLRSKRTGRVVGQGIGSCNSREKRYADRWVFASDVPPHLDKSKLQAREYQGRKGPFKKYLVPNEDICSLTNTILKMAKKRALVDAVLSVTRSSGIFTQDVEDMVPPEAEHDVIDVEARPAPKAQARRPEPPVEPESSNIPTELAEARKRNDLLVKWGNLVKDAEALDLEVEPMPPDATLDEIKQRGEALRLKVKALTDQRKAEPAFPVENAIEGEVMPDN